MYLLDTDTILYALKGHSEVVGHFQQKAARPKALSVITYGELLFGAMKSARRVSLVCVHFVHTVHFVHALDRYSEVQLPSL